jgi:2-C-methyl-D-erythritol 2,4-cyclodiphosphate synthase
MIEVRAGHGFDVHRVGADPGRPFVLGGCVFPGLPGLVGHSDGDAIAHAIADALLGAAGLGDLGEVYPDTEPTLEGADSVVLLRGVAEMVTKARWTIGNVDCSVVCESPTLAPRRAEMEQVLGEAIGAPVSVKGRRAEGMGAIGRGEGVACFAVVVLSRGAS